MTARRGFLKGAGLLAAAGPAALLDAAPPTPPQAAPAARAPQAPPRKPRALRPGDVVGIVSPAFASFLDTDFDVARDAIAALGFTPKLGPNLRKRRGYLAGSDEERAADLNAFFADPEVKGIAPVTGGWGSARLLPHLDYELIRRNPKTFFGFSDITALHMAIQAKGGFVTFHGPNAYSRWAPFTHEAFRRVALAGEAITMANPVEGDGTLVPMGDLRVRTIRPGVAQGRLLGGNLTVLSALVGSPYLPSFAGAILFLEDVEEQLYRIDRMMTQLRLAGLLDGIAGFVFGRCSRCEPGERYASLTLEEVMDDHVKALGVPAFQGLMVGHIERQFTLPEGVRVEIDAAACTLRMLEPAVELG